MKRYPVPQKNQSLQKSTGDAVETHPSTDIGSRFISFRYTYKSMTSVGGKTYVNAREERFHYGKYESESFEGILEGDYLSQAMQDIQNLFLKQISFFLYPFSYFLPFPDDDAKE